MTGKLLIGYQATQEGKDALRLGSTLARVFDAAPTVVTVFPWPDYLMGPKDLEVALRDASSKLFSVARGELADPDVATIPVADRSPARALQGIAEAEGASLIVVGSTRRGVVGRVVMGSVGESLLHGAPCAVAIAPRGPAEVPALARVGVAFDGSPEAWSALETAIAIAERCEARLDVVTVADPPHNRLGTSYALLTAGETYDAQRNRKQQILELALRRTSPDLAIEGRLLTGEAGPALAEAAEDFDLMVVGSRGYGSLRRTALGSATSRLMRTAPCAVLVLPRGAGLDPFGLRRRTKPAARVTSLSSRS